MRTLLNVKFIKGDILSVDLVIHILETEKIDTVMHFAAQSHVDNSFGNSFMFTKNNVDGTHTLLESVRVVGTVKKFVHVSTDEVYGESSFESNESNTEHDSLLSPTNPYAATKAGAEMLVMAFGRSYGLPCIITRGNNVYGPNQYPEKAIPKFIILASKGENISIHGDGLATRSYMHIDDAASAFDFIVTKGQTGHVYNIGAHEERSVLSVAEDICRILKVDSSEKITYVRDRAFNDRRYYIDCAKLLQLGWRQEKSWEVGLQETVRWYTTEDLNAYWSNYTLALSPHPTAFGACTRDAVTYDLSAARSSEDSSPVFLIYGKTGWIGGMLGRLLANVNHTYYYGYGRLQDRAMIEQDIARCRPTHILNAAGITEQHDFHWCATRKRSLLQTNVLGALNLVDVAHAHGVHVTNFTTGSIYTYDDEHPINSSRGFTEEDTPNFRGSYYSTTQATVEDLVKEYDNVMQLRLRMPVDDDLRNPRNIIYKVANCTEVVDAPNSMSVLNELLPLAIEGALRKLTGVYNFTNPGVISSSEIRQLLKDYCCEDFEWEGFAPEEQSERLVARSDCELDGKKLQQIFPDIMNIKSSLIKHVFKAKKGRQTR